MTLQEMIMALVRHWKLIVVGAVLTGGAALGFSLMQTPIYEAEASVAMSRNMVSINLGTQEEQRQLESVSQEQAALLLRRSQDLESRRQALVNLVTSSTVAEAAYQQLSGSLPEEIEGPSDLLSLVEGANDGDAILIAVSSADPQLAAEVANAWAEAYETHINSIFGRTSLKPEVVQKETQRSKAEYQKAQTQLEEFLAQNRVNEINRQIEEKQTIVSSLTKAKKQAVEAVVNAEIEARSEIVSTYVRTQLQNLVLPFQQEQNDRIQQLGEAYATRRKLESLVDSARSLRNQIEASEGTSAGVSSGLSVLLMKVQAFAERSPGDLPRPNFSSSPNLTTTPGSDDSATERSGTVVSRSEGDRNRLEISIQSLSELGTDPQEQVSDLNALIDALEARIADLDASIEQRSSQLLGNKGYEFVNAEIAQSLDANLADEEENLLTQVANSVSRQVLQLQGLEEVPNYSTATKPLSQAVTQLEDEIDQLESELEAERARKKDLTRARDLAWDQYKTLATKVAETDVAASITGTEVRFASPALPPTSPTGSSTKLNTLLGGFVGFILMMGLALIIEHPAIRELRSGGTESTAVDPESQQAE